MSTLVCPSCGARWKIVPEGEGDVAEVCPVCIEGCPADAPIATCSPRCGDPYCERIAAEMGLPSRGDVGT